MNKSVLNTSAILGFTTAITLAGMSFRNSYLTFTGINLGMSIGMANIVNKKSKYEHEREQDSQINNLTHKIKNIQEVDIENLNLQYQNSIEKQQQLSSQINYLVEQVEDINDKTERGHQIFIQYQEALHKLESQLNENPDQINSNTKQQYELDLQQLNFKINNRERQLDKHNKELKKHQGELNTQKANHNKIISQIQKLKNKQEKVLSIKTPELSKIEIQVDILIDSIQEILPKHTIEFPKNSPVNIVEPIDIDSQTLVYIDCNNLYNSLKKINIELDYEALLTELTEAIGATQIKIYDGAFRDQTNKYLELKRLGYQVTTFPMIPRGQNAYKTVGDDVKLAIDMIQQVKSGDRVILVTGDGDFCPVVKDIKQRNVHVTVIAENSSTSRDLRELADEFISLNSIGYKIAKHTRLE